MKQTSEALRELVAIQEQAISAINKYRLRVGGYYAFDIPNGVDIDAALDHAEKELRRVYAFHSVRLREEKDRRATKLPGKKCTPEMMANIRMTKREPLT